ncbi:MAG: EamA family transporter [Elusimicrobiota bacterium]|nr:EamA family transporter [Elusimicrobiota bacterium]
MHALLSAVANVLGGSSYPAATVMLEALPARDAVFIRVSFALLAFLPFLYRGRARFRALGRRDWLACGSAGLFGFGLPLALGTVGQDLSNATSASLLVGMEPVTIVLLSSLFLGERLGRAKLAAMALGLTGATFIAFQGLPRLGAAVSGRLLGDLILVLHGACWALYTVIGKRVLEKLEPMDFAAITTVFGFVGIAAWAAAAGLRPDAWAAVPARSWAALAYLVVAVSLVGTWAWNAGLRGLDASTQANFVFLQPLVGVLAGVGLLGDPFTAWTAGGGALVLAGVWTAHRA